MRLILVCFYHPFHPTINLGLVSQGHRPPTRFINGSCSVHTKEVGARRNSSLQLDCPASSIFTVLLTSFWRHHSDEGRPLLVIRPLVLQPLPVAGDAGDLLAVEVRHRVAGRGVGRVNTVLLDAGEELALLLLKQLLLAFHPIHPSGPPQGEGRKSNRSTHHSHGRLVLALDEVKHRVPQAGPHDPPHGGTTQRDEAERQDGVERDLAGKGVGGARAEHHRARRAATERHERAEAHLPPAPRLAQLEE